MAQPQNMQSSMPQGQMQQPQMPPTGQPNQMPQGTEQPKSKKWIWILILAILILGGAGYYFFLM